MKATMLGKNIIRYGVILNDITFDEEFPIDLGDWVIDKPSEEEISAFREIILLPALATGFPPRQEMKVKADGKGMESLPDVKSYRYLVVRAKEKMETDTNFLEEALRISDEDIWIGPYAFDSVPTTGFSGANPQTLAFFSRSPDFREPRVVDGKYLLEVVNLRNKLDKSRFPEISKSIKMFTDQDTIADTSPLKHLGYFSIIESLLSHKPAPSDSADSITRQLKRNLLLLENRMSEPYNLMLNQFNGCKADKVITKLYDYRSCVAHAEPVEVTLKWLFDNRPKPEEVESVEFTTPRIWMGWYLRKLTQRVLVHALKEPRLVMDLK
ncbi:MAG: hypothetical protein RIE59_07410 [Imperialibacter sp.]